MVTRIHGCALGGVLVVAGLCAAFNAIADAQPPPAQTAAPEELEEPWLEPIPVPFDPELEQQIEEVQEALGAIHKQIVRYKEHIKQESDPAAKATLYEKLEVLRKEREDLEALLNDLVEEAKASQRTAIDEALRRARWLERQQEYWEKKEELLRDRQE